MIKKIVSIMISAATVTSFIPQIPAKAEDGEIYPYTLFASSYDEGAITINAETTCINGNIATNGTIEANENISIYGNSIENANESMIFIFDKINNRYFLASNVEEHNQDYDLNETNININVPTYVQGETTLTGNVNINNALKSLENINLYGEVKNTNNSVIFSKYGDIVIESQNINLNGLIYAPFGSVTISAQNLNLNNVIIIAESIVLNCPNMNANNSSNLSSFVGKTSEPLDIPCDEWQHMKDENENVFPDFFEDFNNWKLLKDTDSDKLPDCVEQYLGTDVTLVDTDCDMLDDFYELFVTVTDPLAFDTDNNGIADGDEDFDTDGLTNYQEYVQKTSPSNSDSDNDDLSDGDEINIYNTNPLEPDTDFDGLSDSDEMVLGTNPVLSDTDDDGTPDNKERFSQSYIYDVAAEECAVEQVIVSMEGTGNLQNTMSVENIMEKDGICSGVVGLVGVPFSIETTSDFETATLSFKIDQSKLGNTDFNDLLFLWYDEENYRFVELETNYDELNNLVSVQTTHFSRYMVVDKYQWYEAWTREFDYNPGKEGTHGEPDIYYNTVLAIDCSGSMNDYDKITIKSDIDSPYEALHRYTCQRIEAATQFIQNMNDADKTAVVLFTNDASTAQSMTDNKENLKLSLQNITSSGGTDFYDALTEAYNNFENNVIGAAYTNNRIILLSDGEDGNYNNTLSLLNSIYSEKSTDKRKSIKIYTIGLGSKYDSRLEDISNISHGKFFKAYTAEELVNIYSELGLDGDFDTTDTDHDGLYDAVEVAGIRLQNGAIIEGCNPSKYDTDNDNLKDGEEIDPKPIKSNKTIYNKDGTVNTVKGYYFVMKSNPIKKDSDGDGFPDKYVTSLSTELYYPYNDPNPLIPDITETALKNDFFSVDYDYKTDDALEDWKTKNNGSSASYGGYQGWMGKYGYTKDINAFCNQQVSGATMHSYGCGIIAVADMFMYLFISNKNDGIFNYGDWAMYLGNNFKGIDFDTYVFYIMMISNYFHMYGSPINGTVSAYLPFNLKTSINSISSLNEMGLNVKWSSSTNQEKCLKNMKNMINNDIPVIFSCSVRESNAMQLYCMKNHIYTKNDYIKADGNYEIAPTVDAHYMVATGIIEYSDDAKLLVGREKMLRIATYGKEYYVDFDDYADRLSSIDTNIMIIEK